MKTKAAVISRLDELCGAVGIAKNDLAVRSGITPSTVYSIYDPSRADVGIVTIKKLCDGLQVSLPEFFNSDLFRDLEQEIE